MTTTQIKKTIAPTTINVGTNAALAGLVVPRMRWNKYEPTNTAPNNPRMFNMGNKRASKDAHTHTSTHDAICIASDKYTWGKGGIWPTLWLKSV